MAKLTLIGFSNYDDHFWDSLSVAPGIDKDILINTILLNGGEFEVVYSNPEFMKLLLPKWSQKWMHTMERWVKLINVDYAPLDNYDRHEEYTDKITDAGNTSKSTSDNMTTHNTGSTTDNTTNTFNGTTEGKVSAFDSTAYQPHDQTTAGNTTTLNGSVSSTSDGTQSGTGSETATNSNERNITHTAYLRGNIGTMSSQEMYLREQEVLKINMYDELANLFLTEFVIPIY